MLLNYYVIDIQYVNYIVVQKKEAGLLSLSITEYVNYIVAELHSSSKKSSWIT